MNTIRITFPIAEGIDLKHPIYEVTSIKVIEPNDIDEILIQPGRDMLTLLTCHPYASGGRYRYVVYCDRVVG